MGGVSEPRSQVPRSDPFGPAAVSARARAGTVETVCPVCGERLREEKCKVVCRSRTCVYRIVFNCAEF